MSDQQNLHTLAEAAQLTGLSVEALRLRIKRGRLASEKGNDGHLRVRLTSADLEDFQRLLVQRQSTLTRQGAMESNQTIALGEVVGVLQEQLARERERADRAEARAGAAERERETMRTEAAQLRDEREEARVRAAAAEAEAKGLRAALDEARRPFWRRWLAP